MLEELYNVGAALRKTIYFDKDDYFREKTSEPEKVKQFIRKAEQFLQENVESINENTYRLYGLIGNYYRIINEPKQACFYLNEALQYGKRRDEKEKVIVNLIRIGEAQKYAGAHEIALEKFQVAFDLAKEAGLKTYDDFILQHRGKCLLELGRCTEAKESLQRALLIRIDKGDDSLISSTEQVLMWMSPGR